MTGNQFRLIRKANSVSQEAIFQRIGKGDRNSIYRAEHLPYVPLSFIRALGEIIGVNLTKAEEAEKYMKQLGVKPPPEIDAVDWKRVSDEYNCTEFKHENLLIGYRRCFNRATTRSEFVDILFQALERGELRQIAHGNGIKYVINAVIPENSAETHKKTAVNRSKKPKNGTFEEEKDDNFDE
ncbi:MAG: hypothetical protein MUF71_15785 [Candidatus Kapabacteria bacterium]|jgi:hypothetical protein|nr:hypothetical protein [Candidatus Kapabacteria bacterium]